ncbi:MAG TPA: isoprenylcysteine carboxylmethyltransferase family protein [Terriglobales bacterium]|nr:isoprenylcysteine carboxylmethyltransferase family protein [Terriglobales bacterium]
MKYLWWFDTVPFLGFSAYALSRWNEHAWYLVWMTVAVAGFACWTTARLQLGKSFTPRAEARALVTHGLYSKFRHPVYTFALVAYLGVFLALHWLLALVVFLVLYSTQLLRIRKEEAVLEQAFGEEYRRYKAGTWL